MNTKFKTSITISIILLFGAQCQSAQVKKSHEITSSLKSSPENRLVLIGDGGLAQAEEKIWSRVARSVSQYPKKTTSIFLGDNIYEAGLPTLAENNSSRKKYEQVLNTQMESTSRGKEAVFVAGNHDWDHGSSKTGANRVRAQIDYISKSKYANMTKHIPANACPDPIVQKISDQASIMYIDSQAITFLLNEKIKNWDGCGIRTKEQLIEAFKKAIRPFSGQKSKKSNPILILAMHHPLETNGTHGGYFSWEHHVFPVYNYNKYIPIPVLASMFVWSRQLGLVTSTDISNSAYQKYLDFMNDQIKNVDSLLVVSGHDHNLQLLKLKPKNHYQIVSGSASKSDPVATTNNTIFASGENGYIVLDLLPDRKVNVYFKNAENENEDKAFQLNLKD